jgi:hypothetical protein
MYKTAKMVSVLLCLVVMICAASVASALTASKIGIFDALRVSM